MSWYGIEAVNRAISRTRKALFEPFDFWKWAKLAIIILLGGAGSGYGSSTNYSTETQDLGNNFPIIELPETLLTPTILIAVLFFLILVLILSYVSSVMEFVFVESLVRNEVKFWAYSRRFLGKGFNLLLVRLAIGLIFLVFLGIAFLPIILENPSDFALPELLGEIFWLVGLFILLALLAIVIESFISLAIPVSIYRDKGILSAFRIIYGNFRKSWKEVVVYWLTRFVLMIGTSIIVIIFSVLVMLVLGLGFIIFDVVLYFFFSQFVSESLTWILLTPFIVIELFLILVTLIFLSVPFVVFMKYHLLSFLEAWFAEVEIPFFDAPVVEPETGLNKPEPGF
jgi:hypothetical protein